MYVYMYVCMYILYVCMSVCMYIYIYIYMNLVNVGSPYWVRNWMVYGRNPVNAKSRKKTKQIFQSKNLFSRTLKQEKRFCPTLCCSEHNNSKALCVV